MRRAASRGRADHEMAVVSRIGEIGPLFRRRQLMGLNIIFIPHQPVAADSKAEVMAVGVMDRKGADLPRDFRNDFFRRGVFLQQAVVFQSLERVRSAYPKDIGLGPGSGLAQVSDSGVGLLVVDDDIDAWVLGFESFLVS